MEEGVWMQIKDYPIPMWGGCATFIPEEHDKVYISGGYQDMIPATMTDKIYAYDFLTDDYELIGNTPETPVASHGCVGIRNSQNQKVNYHSMLRIFQTE